MTIIDTLRNIALMWQIASNGDNLDRLLRHQYHARQRDYRDGNQKRNLKVKEDQADDNLTINYIGLIIDRGVSMLFGKPVKFDFGQDDTERSDYIDRVMKANNYPLFCHELAQFGGTHGTCYAKIMPDLLEDDQGLLPRLDALEPEQMLAEPLPNDLKTIWRYTQEYTTADDNGQLMVKEVTERNKSGEALADSWKISHYHKRERDVEWKLDGETNWEYSFAPIVHWQNLISAGSVTGKADATEVEFELQDGINNSASNTQRILRYHAHPKTWGRGANVGSKASWGADEMVMLTGDNAMVQNLEMQSDLTSSRNFYSDLRAALFSVSRTVDISSLSEKINAGALTNFGLRVLYKDALDKLDSKRLLYGWGLCEINRRLFELANIASPDGGEVVWQDNLPSNETEDAAAAQTDLGMGIVSKETISEKRGYDWEAEQERIANQQQGETNLGDQLLQQFTRGQFGGGNAQEQMQQERMMMQQQGGMNA